MVISEGTLYVDLIYVYVVLSVGGLLLVTCSTGRSRSKSEDARGCADCYVPVLDVRHHSPKLEISLFR